MTITTRVFGEVTIDNEKIIHFEKGIIGFPDLTDFALIYDIEKGNGGIRWMQSIQEPNFAIPVMDPLIVKSDYDPMVEDELLKPIKLDNPEDMLVLVTVTVPKDLTKMTVNLKGPIIINASSRKACQIIIDDDLPVKFPIYDILNERKKVSEC